MSAPRAQAGGGKPDAYRLVMLEGLMGTGKSTMCRLMDAPPDEIVAHARWIADRVRPLGARLIYLQSRSAAEELQRIARTRGRAWLEAMSAGEGGSSRAARARSDSPFFRHRGLHGYAGMVAFLQGYLELCATLVRPGSSARMNR